MNHDGAVHAALLALAEAFEADMRRRGVTAAFEEQSRHVPRFVLDLILRNQRELLGVDNETVTLPAPVLVQLVADAMKVPVLKAQKAAAQKEADDLWNQWAAAKRFMREDAPHDKKQRIALSMLGLIGNEANKGGDRRNHRGIAAHYYLLRTGGNYFEKGELIAVKPHSFIDAVEAIRARYKIDWAALVKACQRKGIRLVKKAEVFPVD